MRNRRPVLELERLLDALEAEILAAADEDIREALWRRQPSNIVIEEVARAIPEADMLGWPRLASQALALGWSVLRDPSTRSH
jgi:hypothetical protein